MHALEPYYMWRHLYTSEEDDLSPFYGVLYSEFEYTTRIYNYFIHPQWDEFESQTLFCKIIFSDYQNQYAIIELIGEWNDALYNDIMFLKRNVIEILINNGIRKFVLIGENVLNFHGSDDCYYEEWFEDLENEGWIVLLNFRDHVLDEFKETSIDTYLFWSTQLDDLSWRTYQPKDLYAKIEERISKYLN